MAALVRAAVGCYDAAKAYRTPFISGKDSLNNQFRYTDPATGREVTIEIPPTLLITGVGIVEDVTKCVTMDLKRAGSLLYLIGDPRCRDTTSETDLVEHPRTARLIGRLIQKGVIQSAHDCSEGGWLVALAEMLIASSIGTANLGVALQFRDPLHESSNDGATDMFAEIPGRYIVEVPPFHERLIEDHPDLTWNRLGFVDDSSGLRLPDDSALKHPRTIPVADLRRAFLGTLDW